MEDHVLAWLKKELKITDETGYLNDWIAARGDIMDVVVEALDMHSKKDILSRRERDLINVFRCMSPDGKSKAETMINVFYDEECRKEKE